MRRLLIPLALTAACGQPDPDPPPVVEPPPDAPGFLAETGGAPALRLEGAFEDGALAVDVLADGLGPVFGIAGRLVFDPSHLAVASAEPAAAPLGEAASLFRVDAGAVVFGFARMGPDAGEETLDGTVRLATVRFSQSSGGDSRLSLARAEVRRADGAFVSAQFLGAEVHTLGGPP